MDGIITSRITLGQSGLGSIGNNRVFHIPQICRTETLSFDGFVSYPERPLEWESYPSAEMQLAYSTTPADCAGLGVPCLVLWDT